MSLTLQQLIDQAISIANRGVPPSTSPALSAEMIAEDLVGTVFQQVGQTVAADPTRRSLLRRTKTVAFAAGSATLTGDVLTQYLSESMLYDPTALSAVYSWIPQWEEFVRMVDRRDGYYCVNESTIAVIQPNAVYSPSSGLSGNLSLVTPCAPAVPAAATDAVVIRDELIDDLVMGLADALSNPLYKNAQIMPPRVRVQ